MPGKHKQPTIAFRPNPWEYALICKRAGLSGLYKKDFISKSCIYGNIVVTGTSENINRIVEEMQIMENVIIDVANQFNKGKITLTDEAFNTMYDEFYALIITVVDILKGSAYLYNIDVLDEKIDWKSNFIYNRILNGTGCNM